MGALETAQELTKAAEKAQQAGDVVASLSIATVAAQYLQLAKLLEPPRTED